jgi:uncharacterized protein
MQNFTPIPATVGGLLIGLAAAILWLGNGRIAGISGMYSQFLPPRLSGIWRLVFLVAMVAGAFIAGYFLPWLGSQPQLSKRSMVAVAVFFGVAILTVTITGIV